MTDLEVYALLEDANPRTTLATWNLAREQCRQDIAEVGWQEWLSKGPTEKMAGFQSRQVVVMEEFLRKTESSEGSFSNVKQVKEDLIERVQFFTRQLLHYHWGYLQIREDESSRKRIQALANSKNKPQSSAMCIIVSEIFDEGLECWLDYSWFDRLSDQKQEFFEVSSGLVLDRLKVSGVEHEWNHFLTAMDVVLTEILAYGLLHEFAWLRVNKVNVPIIGGGYCW